MFASILSFLLSEAVVLCVWYGGVLQRLVVCGVHDKSRRVLEVKHAAFVLPSASEFAVPERARWPRSAFSLQHTDEPVGQTFARVKWIGKNFVYRGAVWEISVVNRGTRTGDKLFI